MDKELEQRIRTAAWISRECDVPIELRSREVAALLKEIDVLRAECMLLRDQLAVFPVSWQDTECTCNERTLEQEGDACDACQDKDDDSNCRDDDWIDDFDWAEL